MTLHNATETMKKASIAGGFGLAGLIILIIFVRVGFFVKDILFPPKINPPTVAYDALPAIQFPPNALEGELTYTLNTDTGELPADFPDRLYVFPIVHPEPNFLNLDNAKRKARALDFTNERGQVLPEKALGNAVYEWNDIAGMRRKLIMDTVTFNFEMSSGFLTYLPTLSGRDLQPGDAIATTKQFLTSIGLFPDDIDITKTDTPNRPEKYVTYPQIFDIIGGQLSPATSLERTKIIRVDLYQKNAKYTLNTGRTGQSAVKAIDVDYPIVYPHPPFSTMSFWVGTTHDGLNIVQTKFLHQNINFVQDQEASYPIKPVSQAYEELKAGQGYIASAHTTDTQIFLKDVYLAYYLGETVQDYLMPIYVFEGENGFFGYVSAITDDWLQ